MNTLLFADLSEATWTLICTVMLAIFLFSLYCAKWLLKQAEYRRSRALLRMQLIRSSLEEIVCTEEPDDGVVLLSYESPMKWNEQQQCDEYLHEHFSPLGDALMEVWRMTDLDYIPATPPRINTRKPDSK